MNPLVAQALIAAAGAIRGTVSSAFGYLVTLIKSGTNSAMQFHQESIAFAREMGMNAKEAQAYTEVLTDRTEKLAMKYGVAAEQVKELQRNISVATSRQLMLNESQAEGFLQLNKLVGSGTVTKFTEQMMNGMGGQLDTVQGAVAKAYATAAKSGLNAQKVSEKIASNLNMANKLSFRTGIEGLTRMAMQAEKVGMSLNSVESAAQAFMEIDDAIQASAKLNMLGGQFAMLGGNPLDMAYEANADPEAFQKRLIGMAQGAAKFDAQKGIATVDPMMMDMLRNAAKAMNLNPDELVGSAKKQASNAYKESHINFGAFGNLTNEQRDFLINKSDVANGKVKFTTVDNKEVDLSNPSNVNQEDFKKVIDEMMKYQGMSDRDIMEENARSLSSINEILTGIKDSITAMFAKFIEGMFPEMQGDLKKVGENIKTKLLPMAKKFGESAREVYNWVKSHKDTIKTIASGIASISKFLLGHWQITLGAIIGKKILSLLGFGGNGGLGSKAASGAANAASKLNQGSPHAIGNRIYNFQRARGRGIIGSSFEAIKGSWRGASKLAKGTALLGIGASVMEGIGAQGKYNNTVNEINNSNMSDAEKAKALENARIDRNSEVGGAVGQGVGSVLGTFFFGPLGGMIGGAVGKFAGEFIGKYWDPIWDGIKNIVKTLGNAIWGGIKFLVDNNPISWMVEGIGKLFGKDWSPTKIIGDLFSSGEKHSKGGVIGGNSRSGDRVPILANSGEAVAPSSSQSPNKTNFDEGGAVGGAKGKPYQVTVHGGEGVITPQQFNSVFGETPVKPKDSLGEKEYIYKPTRSETSNINGNTITVKDFNINLSGTVKLDAGNYSKSINGRELLNDYEFMTEIKNMIKQSINQGINGGRFLNDVATVAGFPSQTSMYGKKV